MNNNSKNIVLAVALIILAVASRIINVEAGLWYNFGLFGAISLFAGAVIKDRRLAFIVPLAAYLLSDIYLSLFTSIQAFYGISQLFTYGAAMLVVVLGMAMPQKRSINILGYSIGGSLIFWIVSNFGVWFGNLFTQLEPGLSLSFTYWRALPFYNQFSAELFAGTFVGDLLCSLVLFGAYSLLSKRVVAVAS